MRKLIAAVGLAVVACVPTAAPPTSLAPSPTAIAQTSSATACVRRDSVPSLAGTQPLVRPSPATAGGVGIPGRLVFLDTVNGTGGRTLTVYESGAVRTVSLPASPVGYSTVHLSDDGLVSAIFADETTFGIWSYDLATGATRTSPVAVPLPGQQPYAYWSPDGRTVAYVRDGEATSTELFLVDLGGQAQRVALPDPYLYDLAWRSSVEMSVVVGTRPTYPLNGASLLTWKINGRGFEQLVSNVRAASGNHVWSPDGTGLVYADRDAADSPERLLRRRDDGTNVIFGAADLQKLSNGCDLTSSPSVSAFGFGWSPDGRLFATIGKMPPTECCWFLAIGNASGGVPALFRAPSECYLNGQGGWLDSTRILAELTGPDCGRTASEARAVIIDAMSGAALGGFSVGRKSALRLSPDRKWVASVYDGGTDFIPIADPTKRIVLPLTGSIVGWCCQ